jgi:hypothetical protein
MHKLSRTHATSELPRLKSRAKTANSVKVEAYELTNSRLAKVRTSFITLQVLPISSGVKVG